MLFYRASLLIGWLPQELLGTSIFEYFHQDEVSALAESHRLVLLKTSESCDTKSYRFRSKDGSFLRMKSNWKAFMNPWTKDIEYIIADNFILT